MRLPATSQQISVGEKRLLWCCRAITKAYRRKIHLVPGVHAVPVGTARRWCVRDMRLVTRIVSNLRLVPGTTVGTIGENAKLPSCCVRVVQLLVLSQHAPSRTSDRNGRFYGRHLSR